MRTRKGRGIKKEKEEKKKIKKNKNEEEEEEEDVRNEKEPTVGGGGQSGPGQSGPPDGTVPVHAVSSQQPVTLLSLSNHQTTSISLIHPPNFLSFIH